MKEMTELRNGLKNELQGKHLIWIFDNDDDLCEQICRLTCQFAAIGGGGKLYVFLRI